MEDEEPRRSRRARRGRGWDAAPARKSAGRANRNRQQPRQRAGNADNETTTDDGEPPTGQRDLGELARRICLRQLAIRPCTRSELATVLRRCGIPEEVAADVLDRYDDVGMIDDAAFAKAWVSSRHHGKGLARQALARELRRRGVDSALADEALETLDPETEAATARALADRKLRGMGDRVEPQAALRRLVGMLARKGYPPGVAISAAKEALAARDDADAVANAIDDDLLSGTLGDLNETD